MGLEYHRTSTTEIDAMKSCPSCLTQYTDDTLLYCLQDGNPLVAVSQSDLKTIAIGETETLVNPRSQNVPLDTRPDIRISRENDGSGTVTQKRRGRTAFTVAVTALVMLLIFGALGIGAFLFLKNRGMANRNAARSDNALGKNAVITEVSPSRTPVPANTRASEPAASPPVPVGGPVDGDLRKEVLSEINGWREMTEEMDLDSLMDHYAPRVDYYNRKSAGIDSIRSDKSRAFSEFDDIKMNLSNVQLTQNAAGDKITAIFDKAWRFSGARTSTGKVRQQLELSMIDGRWLITAERDLKVY